MSTAISAPAHSYRKGKGNTVKVSLINQTVVQAKMDPLWDPYNLITTTHTTFILAYT